MKLGDIGELSIVDYINNKFLTNDDAVAVSIGDDAAVFKAKDMPMLVTTDTMVEGIHFDLSYATYFQVGFKLISINVSDIYAMNGEPAYLFLSLSFNPDTEYKDICSFLDGVKSAADMYKLSLLGGDTTAAVNGMVITATVLGYAKRPVTRAGAKVGDRMYVTGPLGSSACGFELLKRVKKRVEPDRPENLGIPLTWDRVKSLFFSHLMPVARKPFFENSSINSLMDLSDGLAIDLRRLCYKSGVGAVVYENLLPMTDEMIEACKYLDIEPWKLALCGGEDYELLLTSKEVLQGVYQIGEIIETGCFWVDANNFKHEWPACGYEHFKY
ncbi:MAG: thiamine-phosphate kinase [Candidatus Magnetoovum sp. WYHC-5]|nr:thiamine-phosphate kinase [Candidatus Magnetoovum sp. WYHC-5]